jgi:hypothetical protein
MISLPYQVFVRREGSAEPWRAPIWRSFTFEADAERELRRFMSDRSEHRPPIYANITGPDSQREFVWEDNDIKEVTP